MSKHSEATSITLTSMHLYPIKSCAGIDVQEAMLTPCGLRQDRRFMLVDQAGAFVTQRELPMLARLRTRLDETGLSLTMHGREECGVLRLPLTPPEEANISVRIWEDTVQAVPLGRETQQWLRDALKSDLRLVFLPDRVARPVDTCYGRAGDVVSFADGFPFLLTSEASLHALQARIHETGNETKISMARFRSNLVIGGAPADAEEQWRSIRIGGIPFDVLKPCTRCMVTTLDQTSGASTGPEPLKTLGVYRLWRGKPVFGQNLVARGTGQLRVGQRVDVLE